MKARFNKKKGTLEIQDPINKNWYRFCYINEGEAIDLDSFKKQYNITEISYLKE